MLIVLISPFYVLYVKQYKKLLARYDTRNKKKPGKKNENKIAVCSTRKRIMYE